MFVKPLSIKMLRVRDMSGRHSAPKGVPDGPDETAAGDTENEICRSVWGVERRAADRQRPLAYQWFQANARLNFA